MITTQYKSAANRTNGVICRVCDDLKVEKCTQELYIVTTKQQRLIRYVGMSKIFGSNRPVKSHNTTYEKCLGSYPDSYTIYRFPCSNAGELERAGLELLKGKKSGNRAYKNNYELTDEAIAVVKKLFLTYNLKIDADRKTR